MKDKQERLEKKIIQTINKIKESPIGGKVIYSRKLEGYFKAYKELTGQDYRVEIQGVEE